MDQTPQSGALAPPLFFRRIRRSIPVGVSRHAFGDHVDVRVGATVLWVGIADFEHSGRSAGFIYQVVPIGVSTPEGDAVAGAQYLFAAVGDQR